MDEHEFLFSRKRGIYGDKLGDRATPRDHRSYELQEFWAIAINKLSIACLSSSAAKERNNLDGECSPVGQSSRLFSKNRLSVQW
jgi:hypothetical protein